MSVHLIATWLCSPKACNNNNKTCVQYLNRKLLEVIRYVNCCVGVNTVLHSCSIYLDFVRFLFPEDLYAWCLRYTYNICMHAAPDF